MANIVIRPKDLAIVQAILKAALPTNANVYVFGSRAKGTTKRAADLDLAFDLGRKMTAEERLNLADAFEESNLPYRVDMVDLQSVSDDFKMIIERDKVRLP